MFLLFRHDQSCSICMEELEGFVWKTDCNHVFHCKCLFRWMCSQKTCPNCRGEISMEIQWKFLDIFYLSVMVIFHIIYIIRITVYPYKNIKKIEWWVDNILTVVKLNLFFIWTQYFSCRIYRKNRYEQFVFSIYVYIKYSMTQFHFKFF